MKMTKMFTTVFDEEMKRRGFKRQGYVYSRLVGEILQGVVIKTINPYTIHFCACPWWTPTNICCESMSYKKGHWSECGIEIKPDLSAYYREANEEFNLVYMTECLEIAEIYALPFLDKITDIDSYLKYGLTEWLDFCEFPTGRSSWYCALQTERLAELIGEHAYIKVMGDIWRNLKQYAYLYKAYQEGSFENVYEQMMSRLREEDACGFWRTDKSCTDFRIELFKEKMEQNDLDFIVKYKEERRKIILPKLRDELKLDVFHL